MHLVERHYINPNHKDYTECDQLAFKSKNLYNQANYVIRQNYINNKTFLNYIQLDKLMQQTESYKALPSKVSQQTLRLLDRNWKSFFQALKSFQQNPTKFQGIPYIPQYLHKEKGRFTVVYSSQAINKKNILSKTNINVNVKENFKEIRIVCKKFGYIIEVVYEKEETKPSESKHYIAIDLGINNLATITSDLKLNPILVNGRIAKSINQLYNKKLSTLKSQKKINKAIERRYFQLENYFHHVSKYIVNYCVINDIGKIIIGYNAGWKQDINLGKKTNQKFCFIPYLGLIQKIMYKAKLVGIEVITHEESYTSKASALDGDQLCKGEFSGKRVKRGLYCSKDGTLINADVNGSINIGRKVIHELVVDRRLVVRPVKVNPYKHNFL